MASCLLGIGSNLGDRAALIERTFSLLVEMPLTTLVARSGLYETRPVGGPVDQATYLNAAARLATELTPFALLDQLQKLEQQLGRVRAERWGARTIDLDLLLYDELEISSERLTVPHPRFAWRRFALTPAAEVAPDLIHPTICWTVRQLLSNLDRAETYVALMGPPGGDVSLLAEQVAEGIQGRFLHVEYEDPASPSLDCHLRLLAGKRRLLERSHWPDGNLASVSGFSLFESLAAARVSLAASDFATFRRAWDKAVEGTVAPKLSVYIAAPGTLGLVRDVGWLMRYRSELRALVARPGQGPLLTLGLSRREDQVAEIVAAIQSM